MDKKKYRKFLTVLEIKFEISMTTENYRKYIKIFIIFDKMKLAVSFNNYHVLFGPVLLETLDLNCHMFDGKLG